ncbi:MAG TPA: DNA polymerase III subunit delta' [Allosphingosinicella sp.]|uniref:DNA polymerase III subunit delta' n=1 Tax=Allosphingosinicella sp. TaxID=2823234 RepID=UPI002F297CEE
MSRLFGHDSAVAAFRESHASGRLHHAWLISGPEGIGKALFAHKAALRVLADGAGPPVTGPGFHVPDDHRIAKLVAAGSHPDLMRLERLTKESGAELARSISVDQVRGLQRLFATTATFSPWRVVVIDAIDDLERAAANALLKNLEEPPANSLFLLVSHAPERLLPTIRSRCRQLRLSRLDDAAMRSALGATLPDAEPDELNSLVAVGEGSPGRALAFRGLDIDKLDRAMRALASEGDPTNARRVKLAAELSPKAAQGRYEAFLARAPSLIAGEARARRGPALAQALGTWERARDLAGSATRLSLDPHSVVFELGGMMASLARRGTAA